ncbi:Rgg/GadR/MutR family transcriptional regulator [Leuconostoc citreum]|uniref:Rgg family transcriptional regulator n=1 Tax=Leuconostoc citreum TaxID=33964 RepID=UPI0011247787|nr:Rgg/GadR/MutR family transcriptional regulator [Leuconostoc citreum]QEA46390.1 Rgg/GadR/MutR family transcriptional regulator [Leuconostoc citreum]QEA63080.1 Rgg/GadR/MutR family transcriptional regulator [Leuconostoc citreum]TOY70482.1 transcriptional regulator [Leuconostoc citreum]
MTIEKTFHQLRTNKKITLTALSDQNASASFIGKFEKGQTNMSVSRFFKLLEKMHVSQAEFEFLLLEHNENYLSKRIKLIDNQAITRELVQKFYKTIKKDQLENQGDNTSEFLLILASGLLLLLNQEVKKWPSTELYNLAKPVQDYLLGVETWGIYELQIFTLISFMLPAEILYLLTKLAIKRVQLYKHSLLNIQTQLMHVVWTSFSTLVYEQPTSAYKLLNVAEKHLMNNVDLTEKITLIFNKGWYEIEIGHITKGVRQANIAIDIYNSLGYKEQAINLSKQLEHHIRRQDEKKQGYKPDGSRVISIYI